jgi:hypothetical protein
MTDTEFDAAAAAVDHDGKLARENNQGWRTYSCRDAVRDFSAQVRVRIQQKFKININGMAGGATVYEVVEEHRRRSEAGGSSGLGLGGDTVAAAAAPGWTLKVSVCVPTLIFPPSLLTNPPPPPRAQAAAEEHGIASGAAVNSRSAVEHLDAQFALVPSTWAAKGGRWGKTTAKKPDLTKASLKKPSQQKRAKMEAVCAFDARRPVADFNHNALKLDALVGMYNTLPCIQNDPRLAMQGASGKACGRPSNSS